MRRTLGRSGIELIGIFTISYPCERIALAGPHRSANIRRHELRVSPGTDKYSGVALEAAQMALDAARYVSDDEPAFAAEVGKDSGTYSR